MRKKNLFLNSVHTRPVQGNFEKKKLKNLRNEENPFRRYFLPKRDNIGRERERKF